MVKVKEDLTGKTFGQLKVISQIEDYIGKNGIHQAQWLCQCSCGSAPIKVRGEKLKHLQKTNCGCDGKIKRIPKIQPNQTYGKLKVIKQVHKEKLKDKQNHNIPSYWLCQCECGNFITLSSRDFKVRKDLSCGCEAKKKREILKQIKKRKS